MKQIVFATGNPHKLQELKAIAGDCGIDFILPPEGFDPDETGTTFEENSYIKAKEAAKLSGIIALADDSGLCVDVLNGEPGIHSARYAETPQKRIDKLQNALKGKDNRKAKFVCVMTLVSPKGDILFQTRGECKGEIATFQSGTRGFGYDPIFVPLADSRPLRERVELLGERSELSNSGEGLSVTNINYNDNVIVTMADMPEDEKNKISHRARALSKVLKYLKDNLFTV